MATPITTDQLKSRSDILYNQAYKSQEQAINKGTETTVAELERQKELADQDLTKTTKGLYSEYQKNINPYGVNAEELAEQGLGKSGLAETTKLNYYNSYQKARTEAKSNADNIKANFDSQIAQARSEGNISLAELAYNMYTAQIQDLYTLYGLNYQEQRDKVTDSQWQKEYNLNKQAQEWEQKFNQAQFDYTKQRDKVSDSQWAKEYALSKKKSTASSSSKKSSSSSSISVKNNSSSSNNQKTVQEIMKNVVTLQGPGLVNNIKDKSTGKTYASINALLNDYGYAVAK